jgi:hypothetical protein
MDSVENGRERLKKYKISQWRERDSKAINKNSKTSESQNLKEKEARKTKRDKQPDRQTQTLAGRHR